MISAIIVSRGDIDLHPIVDSFPPEWELVVWNNSGSISINGSRLWGVTAGDVDVYGRYAAINYARHEVVYVQNDNCILENPQNVVDSYEPGVVTCNMNSVTVGFGACFDRDLPQKAFDRYEIANGYHSVHNSAVFNHTCDEVLTSMMPTKVIHEPVVAVRIGATFHSNFFCTYGTG